MVDTTKQLANIKTHEESNTRIKSKILNAPNDSIWGGRFCGQPLLRSVFDPVVRLPLNVPSHLTPTERR